MTVHPSCVRTTRSACALIRLETPPCQVLLDSHVVGVVGPACSEAAIGASSVLAPAGIPMVSFAATWDGLVNRKQFPTFFRTV